MKNQTVETILNSLADRFGTTVNHLHSVMLKQAMIDGIETSIALVLVTIAFIVAGIKLRIAIKLEDKKGYGTWEFDDNPVLAMITGITGLVFICMIFLGGSEIIDCFFNPEYYAIHQIFKH